MTELSTLATNSLSVGGIVVAGSPPHAMKPTRFERLEVEHSVKVGALVIGAQVSEAASSIPAVDALFLFVNGQAIEPRDYVYASGQIVMDRDQPVTL